MDSSFTGNRNEMEAIIIKNENGNYSQISKEEFDDTTEGQRILDCIEKPPKGSRLDVILNLMELRLSRTDTGLFLMRAKNNDKMNENSEWSAIFYRKAEVIMAKLAQKCEENNVALGRVRKT